MRNHTNPSGDHVSPDTDDELLEQIHIEKSDEVHYREGFSIGFGSTKPRSWNRRSGLKA